MDREEIEKLIEETARKEREKRRVLNVDTVRRVLNVDTVRRVLNVVFLVCAVVGLILYFALPERHILGMSIIAAGMFLKIVEFLLRFLF